jgi:putative peptide zinc metalloprotease protein
MVCPTCRRWVSREACSCRNCGRRLGRCDPPALELVLPGGGRVTAAPGITLGRHRSSTVQLSDPSVSRAHARVTGTADAPAIVDDGSSTGTWVDGVAVGRRPVELHDGAVLRLGDTEVAVERPRDDRDSGRTSVVPARATAMTAAAVAGSDTPRLRPGYALKRLEAGEGPQRWVLQDLGSGAALRLDEEDVGLLRLLDGDRTMAAVLLAAEERLGPEGPARLATLLSTLVDRGFVAGVEPAATPPSSGLRRLFAPRRLVWSGAADAIDALYRHGGWRLATDPALVAMAAIALAGPIALVVLLTGGLARPLVVADRVGLGGFVFLLGRGLVAAVHETAHGLALAACGRRVREAGLKLVFIFPYAYVDTSAAWLEPRRRRIVVSAAGPASDLVLGGAFAVAALASEPGVVRDILYQLMVGAYLGAAYNLNPFIERDGYQVLVDVLREPGLRARAREAFAGRLRGDREVPAVLWQYGTLGVVWSVVSAALVISVSLRTAQTLRPAMPDSAVGAGLLLTWTLLLAPIALLIGRALRGRPARA